jgi:hypothetical protein
MEIMHQMTFMSPLCTTGVIQGAENASEFREYARTIFFVGIVSVRSFVIVFLFNLMFQ